MLKTVSNYILSHPLIVSENGVVLANLAVIQGVTGVRIVFNVDRSVFRRPGVVGGDGVALDFPILPKEKMINIKDVQIDFERVAPLTLDELTASIRRIVGIERNLKVSEAGRRSKANDLFPGLLRVRVLFLVNRSNYMDVFPPFALARGMGPMPLPAAQDEDNEMRGDEVEALIEGFLLYGFDKNRFELILNDEHLENAFIGRNKKSLKEKWYEMRARRNPLPPRVAPFLIGNVEYGISADHKVLWDYLVELHSPYEAAHAADTRSKETWTAYLLNNNEFATFLGTLKVKENGSVNPIILDTFAPEDAHEDDADEADADTDEDDTDEDDTDEDDTDDDTGDLS